MKLQLAWTLALAALAPAAAGAEETSWIFLPTRYTHSPETGQRVAQFSPGEPAYVVYDDTYQESGFRHNTISLCVGDSTDYLHIVQTWGQGSQMFPFGQCQYPYRRGVTPYGSWGAGQGAWPMQYQPLPYSYGPGQLPQSFWPGWSNQQFGPPGGGQFGGNQFGGQFGGGQPGVAQPNNAQPGGNQTGGGASAAPPPP